MITLLEPGFYKVPAADYHADPAPEASLSGSIAVPLVERSPYHAWTLHPRLNPNFQPDQSKRLDFGKAAHALLLEGGQGITIIDADGYQTKKARELRDAAYVGGTTPILAADYEIAVRMADIAKARIHERFGNLMSPEVSTPECTMIWREGPVWCRGLVDLLPISRTMTLDYKTTTASARPDHVESMLYSLDYHIKAAFYERGLDVLDPAGQGRHRSFFLFQEIDPPHECSIVTPSEAGLTIARKQTTYAIETWQRCMSSGEWPGYSRDVHYAPPPPWIERRWIDREMSDPHATGALSPSNHPPSPTTEITL